MSFAARAIMFVAFVLCISATIFYIETITLDMPIDNETVYDQSVIDFLDEVGYDNLTYDEREHVRSVMIRLKPHYLGKFTNITFVKNITEHSGTCSDDCAGYYMASDGTITIQYKPSDVYIEKIVTHEIYHPLIEKSLNTEWEDDYHKMVFDAANKRIAFYQK